MSCIVPKVEITDDNVIKELGVSNEGKIPGYSIRPAKKYKPTKQAFCLVYQKDARNYIEQ